MRKDIPIRYVLIFGFLITGLFPLLIVSLMDYETTKKELITYSFKQLEAVRNLKANQVSRYYKNNIQYLEAFAKNEYVISSAKRLKHDFFSHKNESESIHAYLKFYIKKFQLYDLFLIAPKSGINFYTVKKEVDFGQSFKKYNTQISKLIDRVIQQRTTLISDTVLYSPSTNAPAQFIATPIIDSNNRLISVVAIQLSSHRIDTIMSERTGMGKTGETYLVGSDFKMRSDSFLDPIEHSLEASFAGTIKKNGVKTQASLKAISGEVKSKIVIDYNGHRVLSSYAPIHIGDNTWAIIAEIDEKEISETISSILQKQVVFILSMAFLLLLLLSIFISKFIEKSLQEYISEIREFVKRIRNGDSKELLVLESVSVDFRDIVKETNFLIQEFGAHLEEKRKLEEIVRHNQRLESIGLLTGGIAHDFNNILTHLYTYTYLVKEAIPKLQETDDHLDELIHGMKNAEDLVRQITNFSRNVKDEKFPVKVSLVVNEVVRFLEGTFPSSIEFIKIIDVVDDYIYANPTHLNQILVNLCTNSLHAMMPEGGKISITLINIKPSKGDECVLSLTIADSGHGIPEDIKDKIFESFFTTKPQGTGTGMGLSIVASIVKELNGNIRLKSSGGQGASFELELPCCQGPCDPASISEVIS